MSRPSTVFHAFTMQAHGRLNKIITDVKVCAAFDPASPPDPLPPYHETKGLWDTGATNSVVTKETAVRLGLQPVGKTISSHAAGTSLVNTYMVNITLPNDVQVAGVQVSECADTTNSFGVIIGMDIIAQGDFAVTNVGGVSVVSYRFPSIARIDYVQEANRARFAGVGPNDPCPCGKTNASGQRLKFKKCCRQARVGN